MTTEVPYRPLPLPAQGLRYAHGPDSSVQPGVPSGSVVELECSDSAVYPGSSRKYWVYVPAGYDPEVPAPVLVFQDGAGFLDPDDDLRAAVVLDNLVHQGHLPPTIGVFVDPVDRNAEYDAFDDRYARFLVNEILAEVRRRWAVTDQGRWGIVGFSSGGSCAFTAAWMRPDIFGRVVGLMPSFAQVVGGNPYPALIASSAREPMRVFLQTAHRDLGWGEPEDNWLAETLRVAAALTEAGHEVRLVVGDGEHDSNHAGALLPDALRWALGSDAG